MKIFKTKLYVLEEMTQDDLNNLALERNTLEKENKMLKRQLEYLRSGEYLNQLKFERNMLEDLVQDKELSNEVYSMKEMLKANTKLCEQLDLYKSVIDEIENWIIKYRTEWCQDDEVIRDLEQLLEILDKAKESE